MLRKLIIAVVSLSLLLAIAGWAANYYWTHRYDALIREVAGRYKLDAALVKAVIYEESYFDAQAQSSQNALGLMQVTPIAAQEWIDSTRAGNLQGALATIGNLDNQPSEPVLAEVLRDPRINLHIGCWYLQSLLTRYRAKPDPLSLSLAAYNAGPSNVEKWTDDVAAEQVSREAFLARIEFPVTRGYVQKIIERYDDYRLDNAP